MKFELTPEDEYSPGFDFMGDCYICIEGDGEATIERRVGDSFAPVTLQDGTPMTFAGGGTLFNGTLTCKRAIKHRVKVATTSGITISIVKER